MKSKVLVLNPSPTSLDPVLVKANLQHEKNGPFDAVILLGDVLPEASTALPTTELKVPTYFSQGIHGVSSSISSNEDQFVDVSSNLKYLNGLFKTLTLESGISILFVSGEVENQQNNEDTREEKTKEHNTIVEELPQVDVLITHNWPKSIANQEMLTLVGDTFIDSIVKKVTPKYHFCVGLESGKFFENAPFKWENGIITRFISLGQEGSGLKWFYAFNIDSEGVAETKTLGHNPFTEKAIKKRPHEQTTLERPAKKSRVVTPDQCFFCLSNPKIETHMIVSIGKHSYMTVAKGPLTRANKHLSFSGHAIIIPIEHLPTLGKKKIETDTYKEMQQYQNTVADAFHKYTPFYKLVTFEINRKNNVHHSIQILPVHEDYIAKFAQSLNEKARYNNENYQHNLTLKFREFTQEDPELVEIIDNDTDYVMFKVLGDTPKIFVATLTDEGMFDFQFPRRVLAHTLNLPKRIYWDKCQQPKIKEAAECEEFKKFYSEFDFTVGK